MAYPRRYVLNSARRWRRFPLFGWYVVLYDGRGEKLKERWVLGKYKAYYLARKMYKDDLRVYRERN